MSLLGFEAVGRLALGQLPRTATTNTIFAAGPASYAFAGPPSAFRFAAPSVAGGFAWSGRLSGGGITFLGARGTVAAAGSPAPFSHSLSAFGDLVAVAGWAALASTKVSWTGSAVAVAGRPASGGISIRTLNATYELSGFGAGFERGFESWFPHPSDTHAWTKLSDPDDDWVIASDQTDAWATKPEPGSTWSVPPTPVSGWTRR